MLRLNNLPLGKTWSIDFELVFLTVPHTLSRSYLSNSHHFIVNEMDPMSAQRSALIQPSLM